MLLEKAHYKRKDKTMRTATNVLNVARGWVGLKESDGSFKEILNVYNGHIPLAQNYKIQPDDSWCDAFVSAVAIKAGVADLTGTECGCERHIAIFKAKGIWIEDGKITPKPGDIILYNWDDSVQGNDGWADHIGYVEQVVGGMIITIEGNKGNAVGRRTISIGHGNIRGYARPKYAPEVAKTVKSVDQIAHEVVEGKWGNGDARIAALKKVGYDPEHVQEHVNFLLHAISKKPIDIIVREVLDGKWGNGDARVKALTAAGYDYKTIQEKVNRIV
jgi:hypothetical protein